MPYVATQRTMRVTPLRRILLKTTRARGMGQDDGGDETLSNLPVSVSPIDTSTLLGPIDLSQLPVETGAPTVSPLPSTLPSPTPTTVATTTPSSTGFNLTNLFNALTSAAVAGQKIYLGTQQPSLVPGTNAIYNPATGQYYNPTTGQVVNPSGLTTTSPLTSLTSSSLGPILLIGGLALGGILIISMLGRR